MKRVQFPRHLPGSACYVPSAGEVFTFWFDAEYRNANRYVFFKAANAFAAQIVLFLWREGSGEESLCQEVARPLGDRVWADWGAERS